MPNDEQTEAWNGAAGEHWAAEAERYDTMNAPFAARIVERLDPRPGEHVLDVGCGNGALALAVAPLVEPGGTVTGLDISGPMLAIARRRADEAGRGNVTFEQGDAQVHPLPDARFDAVVSRFGVMFFDDPVQAFANLRRALKPGGRVVFACWQDLLRNEWITVPVGAMLEHVPMPDLAGAGGPGPFSMADADRVREILGGAGFDDIALEEVVRPMQMGTSLDDALGFLQRSDLSAALLGGVDAETRERVWESVRVAAAPFASADGLRLDGNAWLVTARRPA